jgi:glycerol-3-phosphate dehydrogenase
MNRDAFLQRIVERREPWDIAVVGGGATGVGIAVDAASRGYGTVLLEQSDFGKGTSSRSTKLIHGGVRYLRQGNLSLVMEGLKERELLLQNAPHLVHDLEFIVPSYAWWEAPFYGIGLKIYDVLAGRCGFGRSRWLSRGQVLGRIPTLSRNGLRGGVMYHDGQFDDARLLINLVQTAAERGAVVLNYARVIGLTKGGDGAVNGLTFRDEETGASHTIAARVVINATGPFCDGLRRTDDPSAAAMIAPSQGIHLVFARGFLPGDTALMVPRTRDGRVMFAIPWHGHTLVGTTDTPISEATLEPSPQEQEIDFLLETAGEYLAPRPTRADILSIFTGVRPLVKSGEVSNTAALSRDHTIHVSRSGLLTIAGGKWTTYRRMAEDAVDRAAALARLDKRPCRTRDLRVHGSGSRLKNRGAFATYGTDGKAMEELIRERPDLSAPLHEALPINGAQVVWAARHEWARTIEDVLARRTRALSLDAHAALAMAPAVARLLAQELGRDNAWLDTQLAAFREVASHFIAPVRAAGVA